MSLPFRASDGTVIWLRLKPGYKPEDVTQEEIDALAEFAKEIAKENETD